MSFNKKMVAVVLLFAFISWRVISPVYAQDLKGSLDNEVAKERVTGIAYKYVR